MYVFYDPTVWPEKRSKSKFNLKELKLSDYFDEISSSDFIVPFGADAIHGKLEFKS